MQVLEVRPVFFPRNCLLWCRGPHRRPEGWVGALIVAEDVEAPPTSACCGHKGEEDKAPSELTSTLRGAKAEAQSTPGPHRGDRAWLTVGAL